MIMSEDFDNVEPSNAPSEPISAINSETVHKICSGQVVVNLAVAIKELLENAIDAGGTLIEIRLKEQGLAQFEVIDNGTGVVEDNFQGLTAKYHTSKIRQFCDLESVESFGFRGEALSSLCAVSDMVIITRHSSATHGTKLSFDHNGIIKSKSVCPRDIGTTVMISNLFSNLPVRKKEFHKNIKKEFNRMCQYVQSYCLVSTGVRIVCTNQTSKSGRIPIMSTTGRSVIDNIISIFGTKQANDLLKIDSPFGKSENKAEFLVNDFDDADNSFILTQQEIDQLNLSRFEIDGWVSNCAHSAGRSTRDRQYFYINNRPCEPKQIVKLVNDVYHRFNMHQNPFVYLNIKLQRSDVDVNLTPDKRQLLVNNEKILLLAIKKSLLNTFKEIPSSYKMQNMDTFKVASKVKTNIGEVENTDSEEEDLEVKVKPCGQKFREMLSQWKTGTIGVESTKTTAKRKAADEITVRNLKMKKIQEYLCKEVKDENNQSKEQTTFSYKSDHESDNDWVDIQIKKSSSIVEENVSNIEDCVTNLNMLTPSTSQEFCDEDIRKLEKEILAVSSNYTPPDDEKYNQDDVECMTICKVQNNQRDEIELVTEKGNAIVTTADNEDVIYDSTEYLQATSSENINMTIDELQDLLKQEQNLKRAVINSNNIDRLKFKAEINPAKNKNAEEELETEIKKEMFAEMDIIGQFNLGFIITKFASDLFIIDQHATDEKYNFETLQKVTKLQNQKLVVPQSLELTAVNEMVLLDNLDVFRMNGFEFLIDENAPPTKKIKLIAKPQSQNWQLGKEDIDELIFMLQDAPPNTICRPSRVRTMFASRACRKSVMIGQPLTKRTMKQLVEHMGEIEHPWNCPHGRPTMRHLINLAMLQNNNENNANNDTDSDSE